LSLRLLLYQQYWHQLPSNLPVNNIVMSNCIVFDIHCYCTLSQCPACCPCRCSSAAAPNHTLLFQIKQSLSSGCPAGPPLAGQCVLGSLGQQAGSGSLSLEGIPTPAAGTPAAAAAALATSARADEVAVASSSRTPGGLQRFPRSIDVILLHHVLRIRQNQCQQCKNNISCSLDQHSKEM
jgi:hypothetical protein